jgi:hypothetical protein
VSFVLASGLYLMVLHRGDGGEVIVNPAQIVTLHAPTPGSSTARLFTGAVRCAIGLSDGKWLSVVEPCETIRQRLEERR